MYEIIVCCNQSRMSVSLFVTRLWYANTAEWIQVLLEVETLGEPRNIVLDESPNLPHKLSAVFTKVRVQFQY